MKRYYLTLLWIALLLFSCKSTNITEKPSLRDHYITSYEECSGISLSIPEKGDNIINVNFDISGVYSSGSQQFEERKEFFGDSGFNRTTPRPIDSFVNLFDSIDIVSNADFNSIEAGSSLAEVVVYRNASALYFIESGYTYGTYHWDFYPIPVDDEYAEELLSNNYQPRISVVDNGFLPIIKPLCEVEARDLWLAAPDFLSLRFTTTPTIKNHRFTLTITEGKKQYQASIDYSFE